MKKLNYFYALIVCVFFVCCITACGGDEEEYGSQISKGLSVSLSKTSLEFESGDNLTQITPQKLTITVAGCDDFEWSIDNKNMCFVDPPSWYYYEPGTFEVTVVCRYNSSFEDRKATLTVFAADAKGNEKTATCTITQKGQASIIPVQKNYLIDNAGGTLDIGFKSNSEYTCTIEDDAKNWVHEADSRTRGYSEKVRRFTIDASNTSRREGHITFKSGFVEETISITQTSNIVNGHEYVDLGLPSGTKWATCNVGATAYYEYGDYYAWGETETKETYTEENYKYAKYNNGKDADGFQVERPFYEYQILGTPINNCDYDISGTEYDVAHVKWGGKWRMPTCDQIEELKEYTRSQYAKIQGVSGYKITSKQSGNDNWIFVPDAGVKYENKWSDFHNVYWTSICSIWEEWACYIVFSNCETGCNGNRYYGMPVRPVFK